MKRMAMFFVCCGVGLVAGCIVDGPEEIEGAAATVNSLADDLVVNGSFEEPAIDGWRVFQQIPGWTTGSGCGIEIQANPVEGSAYDGRQKVELDSHCSSSMYQDIATVPGAQYELTVAYRPRRPGIDDNQIRIDWDGAAVATLTRHSGAEWTVHTFTVVAGTAVTRLSFVDVSPNNSLGGLLDAVTVRSIDQDGDGVPDGEDACPDTGTSDSDAGVPEVALGVNRWADVDGDGVFDTRNPPGGGHGPQRSFTMEDTAGCNCAQIIDALDLGAGHRKFGCSIGAMKEWLDLVE